MILNDRAALDSRLTASTLGLGAYDGHAVRIDQRLEGRRVTFTTTSLPLLPSSPAKYVILERARHNQHVLSCSRQRDQEKIITASSWWGFEPPPPTMAQKKSQQQVFSSLHWSSRARANVHRRWFRSVRVTRTQSSLLRGTPLPESFANMTRDYRPTRVQSSMSPSAQQHVADQMKHRRPSSPFWRSRSSNSRQTSAKPTKVIGASYSHADLLKFDTL